MAATALYLAHLNPVTNAHVEIIRELASSADAVHVLPVVFAGRDGSEINSRSFPFGYAARRSMLEAVFGDAVEVSGRYRFEAPFSGYLPPLLSPKSWRLRRSILEGVDGDYFTYTGDRAEGYMLRLYRLRPRVGARRALSASSVKERMYGAALRWGGGEGEGGGAGGGAEGAGRPWRDDVPPEVASIIDGNWETVRRFAGAEDATVKVAGMKFPREGYR